MKTNIKQHKNYTEINGHYQLVLPLDFEMLIPANDSVRLLSHILEEFDYTKLYKAYSPIGRNPAVDPRIMFYENIITEKGIRLRVSRSIQVEGAFGVLKNDYGFNRFLTRGESNVKSEFMLLCLGYNVNKLHSKIQNDRCGKELHEKETA